MSDALPTFDTVVLERDDAVATLTMNRPERRNALNRDLERDLMAALETVRDDDAVRAVVLTGAGAGFCAGADLTSFAEMPNPDQVEHHLIKVYGTLVDLLTTMPKPILAAVNGSAAGAGCSLALACDLRVMADDATLLQAFSNIALVPDAGSTWLLARQVGYSRAYQIAIEGDRIPADRCLDLGLTNKVVPPDDLLGAAHDWAHRLAARPTLALGLTKQAMHAAMTSSLQEAIALEARLQKQCLQSDDFTEGVMAFMQKRDPSFTGS
ncbi:MAG: enoyl-CoA hydratase [Bacteroidetes bacterium]|jgi:2-(1,2-epoxy-1,2-dihydrophenyl)acetyl-CoA isomerase|nr:enoyl-CoA hydratase [Bacteroidota bacterium]